MKADVSNEQRFISTVESLEFSAQDVESVMHSLGTWLAHLSAELEANRFECAGLKKHGALAHQAETVNAALRNGIPLWSQQWIGLGAARALADTLDDKVLLLVFGKFNAGKSSFCNFLAERFAVHGASARYFYLEAGRVVEASERFVEGTTETTTRLQGVRLGEKLVLLDTPGQHSVTPENAALTQRFTDSADAVLWLTSSTSPGQVQELHELGSELHRNKPLLPVVTRSDRYEEDEVDGEIRKCLRNKTAQDRADQEADIEIRAREKLVAMGVDKALLETPVSVSSHAARDQGQTPAAMTEAGFERLYAALRAIVEPMLAYKRRKVAEVWLHHLEENVLAMLLREVLPLLARLNASSQAALGLLEQQKEQIAHAAWRSVMPTLPDLLEKHVTTRDVRAVCNRLSESIFERFVHEANERLADYAISPAVSLAQIELDDDVGFEDIVVEHPGRIENSREVVGVAYERLYVALEKAIRERLLQLSNDVAGQCQASIRQWLELSEGLKDSLRIHEQSLLDIKRELRASRPTQLPCGMR
jgi:tRNA U34 5-carboxymethylaminomethyl modifying GTPase MnmE/TrmE